MIKEITAKIFRIMIASIKSITVTHSYGRDHFSLNVRIEMKKIVQAG